MKKWKVMALLLACVMCMAACGSADQGQGESDVSEQPSSQVTDAETQDKEEAGFVFVYGDTEIQMGHLMSEYLDALGEPISYFEAASCAFDGLDKMYSYNSFQITTYPVGDKDYVGSITFLDDMIETKE